jgi:uncharacterized protein YndB with AHSA1/START domain
MLKWIFVVLLALVAGFAVVVALQPNDFRIVRSTTIAAPPSAVFSQVNNFHNWQGWSPWAKLDPDAKNTFEGPAEGQGAIFHWDGNDQVGAGSMTIIDSKPDELVRIKLDFEKPFKDTSTTEFTFKPDGDKTVVTWDMAGQQDFFRKAICLVMNMQKRIGEEFDKGLSTMKAVVETKG